MILRIRLFHGIQDILARCDLALFVLFAFNVSSINLPPAFVLNNLPGNPNPSS